MYLQLMQEERVTGMILAPTRAGLDKVARMETDFPVVLIDRAGEGMVHDSVVLDNPAMAARLVEHLHERGCRHVAGLFGAASSTGRERRAGFENAAERPCARKSSRCPMVPGKPNAVAALMQAEDRPDALLAPASCSWPSCALLPLGLKVPDDVAVVGFDREGWMDLVAGGLSVIEQPVEAIGRTAMTMLFDRLDDAAIPSRKVVLAGTLVARGSSLHRQEA
jgi:LacI family fructose operon transcriptional repressor